MPVKFTIDGPGGALEMIGSQILSTEHRAEHQMTQHATRQLKAHAAGLREALTILDAAVRCGKEADQLHQQEPVPVEMRGSREILEELGLIKPREEAPGFAEHEAEVAGG